MAEDAAGQKRHIVIVGGGVIGASTAYFLTRHPKYDRALHRITLLEATAIAAGASGKAGGLLALWAYPKEIVPLSYRLHRELAEEHGGAERWGYRRLGCGHIQANVSHADLKRRAGEVAAAKAAAAAAGVAADRGATEQTEGAEEADTKTTDNSTFQTKAPSSSPSSSSISPPPPPTANTATPQKDWDKLPKQDDHAASLLSPSPLPADLDWVDPAVVQSYEQMGVPGAHETAQVHPLHFTTALVQLAEERGLDVRLGAQVTKVVEGKKKKTTTTAAGGVGDVVDGPSVEAVEYLDRRTNRTQRIDGVTDVVVAAGPWTGVVLPRSKVEGLRAHSVVWDAVVSPYAVFTDVGLPSDYVPEHRIRAGQRRRRHRGRVDPEIYARPFGEVYACGEPDGSIPLPATADLVACDEAQCADLVAYCGTFSPQLAQASIKTTQACYLPRHMRFGDERGPLVGRSVQTRGLYVASGHTCWGIQNSPATGCLMAELLLDGKVTSADISPLDPARYKV